jgi:hypothetical protein
VVICGAISQYNNKEAVKGPANYLSLLVNRARMEGFVVMDYAAHTPPPRRKWPAGWPRATQEQGRHRRRTGDLPGDADEVVQRGEFRQVGAEGLNQQLEGAAEGNDPVAAARSLHRFSADQASSATTEANALAGSAAWLIGRPITR